jgi:F-type H+-transporting ATPase subunit gamma
MANLKALKNRIDSVKSTRKITKAMQMVAASKLKQAQARAESARPYTEKMENVLATLAGSVSIETAPPLLSGRRDENGNQVDGTHLIVVATADKGLCGGFNSTIVRATKRKIAELEGEGKKVKLITIGKKGLEQLRYGYDGLIVHKINTADKKQQDFSDAKNIANRVIAMFEADEIDSCTIVYNKYVNALTQIVTFQPLIPLEVPTKTEEENTGVQSSYEYEPSEESVLADLLPRNIAVQAYHAILENAASEQGSRMTAMDSATRNAGDMINGLTLKYNRSRQAAITTELIEIIAGAESV